MQDEDGISVIFLLDIPRHRPNFSSFVYQDYLLLHAVLILLPSKGTALEDPLVWRRG